MATYFVELWDHETQRWSADLARDCLKGPNVGLSWREIGKAIRVLRNHGWDDPTMYVERDGFLDELVAASRRWLNDPPAADSTPTTEESHAS